jgi:hypothetical protein
MPDARVMIQRRLVDRTSDFTIIQKAMHMYRRPTRALAGVSRPNISISDYTHMGPACTAS